MVTRQATAENAPMASCCHDRQPTESDEADLGEETGGVLVEVWGDAVLEGGFPGVFGKLGKPATALFPAVEFVTAVPLMRVAFLVALRLSVLSDVSFRRPSPGPWETVTGGVLAPVLFVVVFPDIMSWRHLGTSLPDWRGWGNTESLKGDSETFELGYRLVSGHQWNS
jgi:hypothetical protein